MRGFIGLCLLITGLSIGAYSHYPGPAQREASLAELTEIVTGAIHKPSDLGALGQSANAAPITTGAIVDSATHVTESRDTSSQRLPTVQFERRGWFANSKILAANRDASQRSAKPHVPHSSPMRVSTHQEPNQRAPAIQDSQKLVAPRQTHHTLSSRWRTAVVRVEAAPVPANTRISSLKPNTDTERWKLVKSLQAELKRVGCYWGKVDGIWGKGSKWALADFMKSVNAALPTDDPDYIQLQLISSHGTKICGRGDDDTVQIAERKLPKVHQPPQWRTKVARAGDIRPDTSPYRLVTGAVPDTPPPRVAAVEQRRPAPLPGRMSIGALERAPVLIAPPRLVIRRHANRTIELPKPELGSQKRIKVTALTKAAPELDLKDQQVRNRKIDTDRNARRPSRGPVTNPYVEQKRSAAARRAKALRKASTRKKQRRYYRSRHRTRSLQSMFMHPLGRR